MKIDKKKEFKKKLTTYCSLLQVSDPLKIIADEAFINLCIVHKISIKDELNKLLNRQFLLMTTKCISHHAKKLQQEEAAYAIRKLTHYKCNHNEHNIRDSVQVFFKKMNNENNPFFSPTNYFENKINVIHNFDSRFNTKSTIHKSAGAQDECANGETQLKRRSRGAPDREHEENQEKGCGEGSNNEANLVKCTTSDEENKMKQEKSSEEGQNDEANQTNGGASHGEKEKTGKNDDLSESIKCIIDLVKNNNEKKFFIATNNSELRCFLRKVFLVPIIYINESGTIKLESISTKNIYKKENVELKKMKMMKWERDIKKAEQRKDKEHIKKNIEKKKKKKKRGSRR
ncbi:conserved Plasmodium protein, unknown function [Plasmodium ovale]|nr:conserved Plasmodium protein, unknown function [Plasmodium ovale]